MIENIPKEKILEVVREGPTLPARIAKRVGGDTMIIGAILSTLINTGDVAVSTLKIGGSPLYYSPGQEDKLEGFIDHLNEKDQKTFNMLKVKNVMHDASQEPLTRVSLKAIKDFAKPVEVDYEGKKQLFWRFYSYDREQAIKDAITFLDSQKPAPQIEAAQPIARPVIIEPAHVEEILPVETMKPSEENNPVKKHKIEQKPDHDHKHKSRKDFFELISEHIHTKGLDIISKEKIKKTEYTFVLKNHETNEYIYCVAKDKKSINEGVLSTAYVFAHAKNMPCMFLMTGEMTKKAESITAHFKEMIIEKV